MPIQVIADGKLRMILDGHKRDRLAKGVVNGNEQHQLASITGMEGLRHNPAIKRVSGLAS